MESLLLCARTAAQNRFTTVKSKDHSRVLSFFGGKKIFSPLLASRREGKRVRRDEGFGKSSRKNGDHVHYRPVNSHSLTTHFLDRRRHFFFYAGTIEANEISPSREFEESFISTTLYCIDTLNYAIQICHRNQFLYLLRFAFNFVINGVDLINRSLRIFLSIFEL